MNYSKEEKAKLLEGWRQSGKSISAYVKEKCLELACFPFLAFPQPSGNRQKNRF